MRRLQKLIRCLSVGALALSLTASPAFAGIVPVAVHRAAASHAVGHQSAALTQVFRVGAIPPQREQGRMAFNAADLNNDVDLSLTVIVCRSPSRDVDAVTRHAILVNEARFQRHSLVSQHACLRI